MSLVSFLTDRDNLITALVGVGALTVVVLFRGIRRR